MKNATTPVLEPSFSPKPQRQSIRLEDPEPSTSPSPEPEDSPQAKLNDFVVYGSDGARP